jgi:hypothetical protein
MPLQNPPTNPTVNIEQINVDDPIVRGPQGIKGDKGDLGDVGPQGPQGDQGAAGVLPAESSIGAALRTAVDAAAGRGAIGCDPASDNYAKSNHSIKTGDVNTSERWLFVPTSYDNYTRIVISRGFNDDSYGYGVLSAVISVSVGAWGSGGGGAALTIEKYGDFGWVGAFPGATNHLMREVRLVEGTSSEVGFSGLWLKLMGDRTYKIAGAAGAPVEYAAFQPTAGLSTIRSLQTPRGRGVIRATYSDYNGPDFGYEAEFVLRSPNGTRYRINVDNSGTITTTPA